MPTIFNIEPTGMSTLVFDTLSIHSSTTGYYAHSADDGSSFNFNEGTRLDIIYSDTRFGGRAISKKSNLVPINFTCFVWGTTRAEMLSRSHTLNKVLMNSAGGWIEYRPDGASVSTYYRYEMSKPASLSTVSWDAHVEGTGKFVSVLEVEIMTHPDATSRYPVDITTSRSIIANTTYGSYYNYFDVTGIKGDLPAIVQVVVTNIQSGTNQELNRLYVVSRSSIKSTLSNIKQIYEAETATITGEGSVQSDTTRSGGSFVRVEPAALDTWTTLKFSIDNEADHRGRIAIFGVLKPSLTATNWKLKIGYGIGTSEIWMDTNQYSPEENSKWHIAYLGELDFPPITTDDSTTISPSLIVKAKLDTGTIGETLDIDFVSFVFSDESIQQINISDTRTIGTSYNQRLLSTFDQVNNLRVAQITNLTYEVNYSVSSIYGSPYLEAVDTTRYFMMFERVTGSSELHVPSDVVNVTTKIIYRTIFPFGA